MGLPAASAGPPQPDERGDGTPAARVGAARVGAARVGAARVGAARVGAARVGVVVPIRSFVGAKERLAGRLSSSARAELAQQLATHVVTVASPLPVVVVSSAPEVQSWAHDLGADVLDDPGTGLDAAAMVGCAHLATLGFDRAIVAHGDLPDAGPLAPLVADADPTTVVLVPCHRDDGTNVCSVPLPSSFEFSYGPGSFRRHHATATRLGMTVVVVRRADLAFDVDVPADYDRLLARSEP